ncbi:hypothetical protein [Kitasatospora purpeofusca]|uniref:hypothetical protein n=1 Tax=Kitasatospora purpeofusca TaxID=67352 RepID=UPI00365A1CE9
MRLRSSLAAAPGGLMLAVALPSSPASAATGDFVYTYVGLNSVHLRGELANPASAECINIPETVGPALPAFAPRNYTNSTATVFLDEDCNGDTYYVMPPGKRLGDRLRLRSVVFS